MFYSCQFLAPVFCTRKMAPETPFTPASFLAQETCDRNLHQKLASLNAALDSLDNMHKAMVVLSSVQTGKFLTQVFLHQKTCAKKRAQVTRSHYASFLFKKWLYALEKSTLQSIVQSAAEFHNRNLHEI